MASATINSRAPFKATHGWYAEYEEMKQAQRLNLGVFDLKKIKTPVICAR